MTNNDGVNINKTEMTHKLLPTRDEARKMWIAALRSGKYQQTKNRLRSKEGFCCLGVACEIFKDYYGMEWRWIEKDNEFIFANQKLVLPYPIQYLLGLRTDEGMFEGEQHLSHLNDSGESFEDIADVLAGGKVWAENDEQIEQRDGEEIESA